MKTMYKLVALLFTVATAAHAQVAPAATMGAAGLNYTLRYSEAGEFGGDRGDWQTATASGQLNYSNAEESHPFRVGYTGGYTWIVSGPSYGTGLFQRLYLSQGFIWQRWFVTASDNVSYLPEAPTTGFSGVPGTGEPIGEPDPSPPSSQSILTVSTHVLNNSTNGGVTHPINYAMTFNAGGGSEQLRYINSEGLDTDGLLANAGLSRRLNARNSLSGSYMFSQFSYPGTDFSFMTNTAFFGFSRRWSPRFSTNGSAGPQWIDSSNSAATPTSTNSPAAPASINVAVNASAIYQFRSLSANLSYTRGASGGAGYLYGGRSDAVNAKLSREFGRLVTVGLDGSYRRLEGLQNNGVTASEYFGVQANRRFGQYLNAFANYTVLEQSSSSALPFNALSGTLQEFSVGIGYSPRGMRLRH